MPVAVLAGMLALGGGAVALRSGGSDRPTRPTATPSDDRAAPLRAAARATLAHRSLVLSSPDNGSNGITVTGVADTATGNSRQTVRIDAKALGGAARQFPGFAGPSENRLVGNRVYLHEPIGSTYGPDDAAEADGDPDAETSADGSRPDGPRTPPKPWTGFTLTPDEVVLASPVALLRAIGSGDAHYPLTSTTAVQGGVRYRLAVPHGTDWDPTAVTLDVRDGEVVRILDEPGQVPEVVPTNCPGMPDEVFDLQSKTAEDASEPETVLVRGSDAAVTVAAPPANDVELVKSSGPGDVPTPEPLTCEDLTAPPSVEDLPSDLPGDFPTDLPTDFANAVPRDVPPGVNAYEPDGTPVPAVPSPSPRLSPRPRG